MSIVEYLKKHVKPESADLENGIVWCGFVMGSFLGTASVAICSIAFLLPNGNILAPVLTVMILSASGVLFCWAGLIVCSRLKQSAFSIGPWQFLFRDGKIGRVFVNETWFWRDVYHELYGNGWSFVNYRSENTTVAMSLQPITHNPKVRQLR